MLLQELMQKVILEPIGGYLVDSLLQFCSSLSLRYNCPYFVLLLQHTSNTTPLTTSILPT